jgi:hypothetical protein
MMLRRWFKRPETRAEVLARAKAYHLALALIRELLRRIDEELERRSRTKTTN